MQNDREPRKVLESTQTEWVARSDASDQPSLPGLDLDSVSPAEATDAIVAFLRRKWTQELDYRLIKELWDFRDNRIAVRFKYEWHDDSGNWFRAHGNELWEFDERGLMRRREASINDVPILASERKFLWDQGPRPEDHPGLTELGL